jgi:hypothetical protein
MNWLAGPPDLTAMNWLAGPPDLTALNFYGSNFDLLTLSNDWQHIKRCFSVLFRLWPNWAV